jgi:hypothetical protein
MKESSAKKRKGIMDDQFKNIVSESKSILILLPTKPFFDQVAAGLALFLALRQAEKDVQIVSSSPMTVDFNRIIGINKITQELGSKNLIIKFLDYNPKDIERVKYDLEGDKVVYLSVIPMPGKKAPAKDQVQLSYSGIAADAVFLIGGTNDSHFPQLAGKDLASAKLVHIGIKDVLLTDKHPISLSRPASSVSEVIYFLLKNTNFEIDQDVASDLLMGIEQETDNFSARSANADTFMAVADLMKRGARRFASQSVVMQSQFPPGAIPGMPPGMPRPLPQGMQMPQGQMPPGYPMPPQMQMPRPGMPQQMPQDMPYPMPQAQAPLMPTIPGGFTQQPQAPRQMQQQQQSTPQPAQQARAQNQGDQNDANTNSVLDQNPPEEWLAKPKVYKGTSVN